MTLTNRLYSPYDSPLGALLLSGDEDALTGLWFLDRRAVPDAWHRDDARFRAERESLECYFAGEGATFDFAIRLEGDGFERDVWEALLAIPFGTTTTYGALAAELGAPDAARAVGSANARNPIAIVVPCHRVIGAGGKLTGYGGGLDRKRQLLTLEGALLPL